MSENTIVVVDDDDLVARSLRRRLEVEGYTVVTVKDAQEALPVIEAEKPGLVLLDIMMPGISGYDICYQIKTRPDLSHIPVVMLSARDMGDDVELALAKKADWYIVKPYDDKYLISKVKHFMRGVK